MIQTFQVIAPHSAHHYIFVPKTISDHKEKILQMLDMHCGQASGVITEKKGTFSLNCNKFSQILYPRLPCVGG
jgi:hypothetical protein